ncbi:MAG: RNA methyltransferase, partial [Clostridiales bacterium]
TGLLEYPQYTRPPVFQDLEVPKVLQSGNHQDILLWRREKALERTWQYRRELLEEAALTEQDMLYLEKLAEKEQKPFNFFVALLHHPVYNKKKQIITTSLTNLDLHDIARASATFGVEKYHLVQPVENQRKLIGNLLEHWQGGFGAVYNPHRKEALSHVVLTSSIEETISMIEDEYGSLQLIATSAQPKEPLTSYKKMRAVMEEKGGNYLLLLGTGWGLTEELMAKADYRLRPIYGRNAYNHLSVRSAASIMLDRLLGEKNSH